MLINTIEPKSSLLRIILARINLEKRRLAKIRLLYTSIISLFSLAGFLYTFQYLLGEFSQSGFYQYFSLIFSDGKNILLYWKELSFSLLESLPVTSATMVLGLLLTMMVISKYIISNAKIAFNNKQLA